MADGHSDSNEKQITIRIPAALLAAIHDRQARMRNEAQGVHVTTSDAVRSLLLAGLAAK